MGSSAARTAGVAIALLLAGRALATGLGEASGRAVLGQPLHIEIPILGSGGTLPARNCFRLQAPRAEVGNEFAVRNGRIEVTGSPRDAKLIVTTAATVSEPVIGFAVSAGCDIGLSRDYVLLVALPSTTPVAHTAETPAIASSAEPVRPAKATPQAPAPSDLLRVDTGLTLEGLAQQKYPLQPKAREKFMRMMMQANPSLTSIEVPIVAGAELRLPPGLPQRRTGPYRGEGASQKATASAEAAAAPASPKAPARGGKAGKDRLVLGTMVETNEAKLLAEAERLTNVMLEQNKAQDELIANIAKLEADYAGLREQFVAMQAGLARAEAERAAAKRAVEESKSSQFIELLLAVLVGGAAGGAGLHWAQRRRNRTQADEGHSDFDSESEESPVVMPPPVVPRAVAAAPAAIVAAPVLPLNVAVAEPVSEVPPAVAEPAPAPLPEVVEESEPQSSLEPLAFAPVSLSEQEKSLAPLAMHGTESPARVEAPQETLTLDFPEISIPAAEHGDNLDFRNS